MKFLDMDTWERKAHFHFFSQFDEPFWGVTAVVDTTKAYQKAKDTGSSFFLWYLHASLVAANRIKEFRYRIDEQHRVLIHDTVDASPTINRPDGSFGFSYIKYAEDFSVFEQYATKEIERVRSSKAFIPATASENVIHYSSLPWLNFTSLTHARRFSRQDSIPKISFGKLTDKEGKKTMPVAVHVHHGLIDGYQVGQYYGQFQELLNS